MAELAQREIVDFQTKSHFPGIIDKISLAAHVVLLCNKHVHRYVVLLVGNA